MTKRQKLIDGFSKITEEQKGVYFRMYGDLGSTVEEISKKLSGNKLDWAITQIENTILSNANPKPVIVPPKVEPVPIEARMLPDILDVVREAFFEDKMESPRSVIGGGGKINFNFEGKDYTIEWDGFWDRSDWVEFRVSGNGVDFKHTEYYD